MTDQWWRDDEELLAQLGDAVRAAMDVPDRFIEAGKGAFTWHGIDAELAQLVYDSATTDHPAQLASVRGRTASVRALTFSAGLLTIEIEITADAVRGQLIPPQPGEIDVRDADGTVITVIVDEIGWFMIVPAPPHSFQLRVRAGSAPPVMTGWISS